MTALPRIMMVAQPTTGGTARHVLEVARGCRDRGFEVHLVCDVRQDDGFRRAIAALDQRGVAIQPIAMAREIDPVRDASAALRLRRAIVGTAPDVLHLHSSKAGALGRAAVIGLGPRRPVVVYTPHAYAFVTQPGSARRQLYRWLERAMMRWTDRVVAVSDSEARIAARLGGQVEIVRNGVDEVPATRRARGRRLRIGWLGRMTWQKNVGDAITSSVVLHKLGVQHELVLGGDGPGLAGARASIAALDAGGWVRVCGFVTDPGAFHRAIDILLITSRGEGLPYAGLDAMAHGVPIVSYDVPGARDLVAHGVTGLLAPREDPGALAAQLARLARAPRAREAMAGAARRRVQARFRLDHQLDRICALYQELTARPHANPR